MNDEQLLRYSRHVMLEGFDIAGQEALTRSSVLIIGAGGLGCPAAMYLASAGVGQIVLVDDDAVELSNLQRQIGHREASLGRLKVESLRDMLLSLNSGVQVTVIPERLGYEALLDEVASADVVLDCSDNFASRFLLNRACVEAGRPLVSGAAVRSEGQVAVFDRRHTGSPCYRCLYDDAVEAEALDCANNGVLAPLVGVVGSLQAVEALKLLSGYGKSSSGKLLVLDVSAGEWRQLNVRPDRHCPVCGME